MKAKTGPPKHHLTDNKENAKEHEVLTKLEEQADNFPHPSRKLKNPRLNSLAHKTGIKPRNFSINGISKAVDCKRPPKKNQQLENKTPQHSSPPNPQFYSNSQQLHSQCTEYTQCQ